jgi:hypothetical protein
MGFQGAERSLLIKDYLVEDTDGYAFGARCGCSARRCVRLDLPTTTSPTIAF